MKFKSKKAIMATALSAIIAGSSFSTAAFADSNPVTYRRIKVTSILIGNGEMNTSTIYDEDGNIMANRDQAVPGKTYTIVVNLESGMAVVSVVFDGVEYQPNATGTYSHSFVMPDKDLEITIRQKKAATNTDTNSDPIPKPTWKRGDVNLDGYVNAKDATVVLKHVVGLEKLTGQSLINADVNGDGYINAKDATEILKIVIGLA